MYLMNTDTCIEQFINKKPTTQLFDSPNDIYYFRTYTYNQAYIYINYKFAQHKSFQ